MMSMPGTGGPNVGTTAAEVGKTAKGSGASGETDIYAHIQVCICLRMCVCMKLKLCGERGRSERYLLTIFSPFLVSVRIEGCLFDWLQL